MAIDPKVIGTKPGMFPWFRCPGCKGLGKIDDDQFNGRQSIDCTHCPYHARQNWNVEPKPC